MAKEKKFRKKKLGSYPFLSVVFSITLALFVMGLFGLLLLLTNNLTRILQENVEMQVFLNKNLSQNEIVKIVKTLSAKDFVVNIDGVAQVTHTTKEDAAKQFTAETGEDFVKFLGDNPLRDVVSIKINPDFQADKELQQINKEISLIRGVFEVTYVESLVTLINQNVKSLGYILMGFSAILLFIVVILINNTIKLALFSQRFLIRSMQLVGATGTFIRKPFLLRSCLFGIIAGLISGGMLWGVLQMAERVMEGIISLLSTEQLMMLLGVLVLIGLFVAFMSTFAAIQKYMKMSLDELY